MDYSEIGQHIYATTFAMVFNEPNPNGTNGSLESREHKAKIANIKATEAREAYLFMVHQHQVEFDAKVEVTRKEIDEYYNK